MLQRLFHIPINYEGRIFGLDLMRAIAILMVVIGHGNRAFLWEHFDILRQITFLGFFGVELFFVLSGFLIGTILIKLVHKTEKLGFQHIFNFWIRRWFRTLPNYYLMLAINYVVALILVGKIRSFHLGYLVFLQNFAWPQPAFFSESWSLAVEEWFYLLMPLGLLFFCGWLAREKRKAAMMIFILGAVIALNLVRLEEIKLIEPGMWTEMVKKVVVFRLDAIFFGVFLAWLKYFYPEKLSKVYLPATLAGVGLIVTAAIFNHELSELNSNNVLMLQLIHPVLSIGITLIFPFFLNFKTNSPFLIKSMTKISVISYAMYLTHYFLVIGLIFNCGLMRIWYINSKLEAALAYTLYLLLTFTFSVTLYKYFEKPCMDLREQFAGKT